MHGCMTIGHCCSGTRAECTIEAMIAFEAQEHQAEGDFNVSRGNTDLKLRADVPS